MPKLASKKGEAGDLKEIAWFIRFVERLAQLWVVERDLKKHCKLLAVHY